MSNEEVHGSEVSGRLGKLPFGFRGFSTATLVGTYILMMLGAYTKAIGAGLACPDWPKCYGVWIPFLHPDILANSNYSMVQILAEWLHRGVAMIVGFMILGMAIWSWKTNRSKVVVWSSVIAVLLLPAQIVLGGLTVTENLAPIIVTSHLGTATLILIAITVATTVTWYKSKTA